ncbi:MarR family transcriptional regulator [Mycolicibacterium sp. CBMA 226]|uniref:MarR family transcriptional regulator n=1 Tax=Mycolicibacterium sp. CBMA 226 TaxID=2606611 RepID=UPI0012DEE46A|nr:MarR family transcriptional regulator [Mycolicibacterium sp. CBMA 226]MUL76424.1 PDZ domain-containing protein [Mycolicibacterium sp. CBMA 226]
MGQTSRSYGIPEHEATWDTVDYLLADWARERPDLDFSPLAVVYRMGQVRRLLEQRMAEVFARHGLTAADFLVIVTLRRAGKPYRMPQARLMNALGLTSGTVSLRLDRLVKAGCVIREPDPDDRRGSIIRLSESGLTLFDAVAPEHLANEDRLLSALTADQRTELAGLLRHLLVSLESPRNSPDAYLGMSLESAHVARSLRTAVGLSDTAGLLVSTVESGSPAAAAGFQRGDLITEVERVPVSNLGSLATMLAELDAGESVELVVLRGDEPRRMTLRRPLG